jgi:hypothetical protein
MNKGGTAEGGERSCQHIFNGLTGRDKQEANVRNEGEALQNINSTTRQGQV